MKNYKVCKSGLVTPIGWMKLIRHVKTKKKTQVNINYSKKSTKLKRSLPKSSNN
jgi:hypothetical protein